MGEKMTGPVVAVLVLAALPLTAGPGNHLVPPPPEGVVVLQFPVNRDWGAPKELGRRVLVRNQRA